MKVSVVICTYTMELYEHVQDAADAVLNQTYDDIELVLISDGDDEVCKAMQADYGDRNDVRIKCHAENRGLSYSRNQGIYESTGDIIAFVDDDAVPNPTWAEHLVDGYQRHEALAVGGKMTPIWVDQEPEFLPEEFYWIIGVTHLGYPEEECEVRNTNGSNMSFRRVVLEELDGFDEILGRKGDRQLQGEETELAARLYARYGEGMWYLPKAEVGHKVFDYRTNPRWLFERAFWQGYSKFAIDELVADSGAEEHDFLWMLAFRSIPRRIRQIVTDFRMSEVKQLFMIVLLTATVGLGYLYGLVRFKALLPLS
jgi:glycosyltransferase involved in cell wall biosynthesis